MVGRRIADADLEDFRAYYGDPRVVGLLSPQAEPYDAASAAALFEGHMAHWRVHGFGTWVFRDASESFVGRGGLRSFELDGASEIELFYGISAPLWGRGYATEMARGIVDVAFGTMALDHLVAFTLPTNGASLRVLEKCGFRDVGMVDHAGLHHCYLRLDAS